MVQGYLQKAMKQQPERVRSVIFFLFLTYLLAGCIYLVMTTQPSYEYLTDSEESIHIR